MGRAKVKRLSHDSMEGSIQTPSVLGLCGPGAFARKRRGATWLSGVLRRTT